MKRILSILKRQDLMNQILLAVGFILCIVSIFMKQASLGLMLLIVVCLLAVSRSGSRRKRLTRLYGALFFHMPDGEIYPMTFEQVKAEYTHGQQGKYNGRKVTVRFFYCGPDENGDMDTGCGLVIHAAPEMVQRWKKGQLLAATGEIRAVNRQYFIIDRVEEIRLTTEKEDLTVSDTPTAEDHTKQEDKQNEIHD